MRHQRTPELSYEQHQSISLATAKAMRRFSLDPRLTPEQRQQARRTMRWAALDWRWPTMIWR